MARELHKLSAIKVARERRRGYHSDGGGLFLRVGPNGTRSWVFRWRSGGKLRETGLGSLASVSLAEARAKSAECRKLRSDGVDPIAERKRLRAKAVLDAAKSVSFRACWAAFLDSHEIAWKNAKHRQQWRSTLASHAAAINDLPAQGIDTALVVRVLEPIWVLKPETASRLRQRIERVLDWARVRGYREGENPARWKGHLDQVLPAHGKIRAVKHHSALPHADVPDFMIELRAYDGIASAALEFAILTAARTGEVIGAKWDEVDFANRMWIIPAERMKAGREHRVPLSAPAIAVLRRMEQVRQHGFVFPGGRRGKPLSNMGMLKLLARMGRSDLTVHGFRSTFRDWAAERSSFPREVAEAALAHAIGDKVEAAYRRGDLIEKRRRLMDAWASFCAWPASKSRQQESKLVVIGTVRSPIPE